MASNERTYADIESFITMLRVACEDPGMNQTLQALLSQPGHTRSSVVMQLVEHLRGKGAPQELIEAFVCLVDNDVADKAYEVITNAQASRKN